MSIGALVDLGLDSYVVMEEIKKLGLKGYDIEFKKMNRFSISGTDVKVTLNSNYHCDHTHSDHQHGDHQQSDHQQSDHQHSHTDGERNLADIRHIINESNISQNAKEISIKVFTEIAQAEAKVHGKNLDQVHFHEVGAVDSIVDIVGAAICIDLLKVDRIYCSPVHEGKGFINCKHGRLPVPVPAVIQMLGGSGISIVTEDIEAELVTPTGFGILKTVSQGCGKMPEMLVESVGYGFGKTETGSLNALRVVLGTTSELNLNSPGTTDAVSLLETNIDNTTGEILGYTLDKLLEEGALDVFFTPIYMKKNRPAIMLSVICKKCDEEKLSHIIFEETSTIGIRRRDTQRITLEREIRTVKTELGEARVKSVTVGRLEKIQPEYDDCVKLASVNNLSLHEVYEIVKRRYYGK